MLAIDPPGAKHVVRIKQLLVVEKDVRVGVETFEHKLEMLTTQEFRFDGEGRLILPIGFANPLQLLFIVTIEGIVDQLVLEQVRMNATGHGCRIPRVFSILSKLPAGKQSDAGLCRGVGFRLGVAVNCGHEK